MSQAEAEFWSFVAREREISEARETAFSLTLRQENGAEYWTGYADALEDVLNAIRRREVRA